MSGIPNYKRERNNNKMLPKVTKEMSTRERIAAYLEAIEDERILERIYRYIKALWIRE